MRMITIMKTIVSNDITDDNNDDGEMHCDQAMVCQ